MDGSKSFRRAELFAENNLTFKIIHLIRDGRAFCSSFIKNKELSEKQLLVAAKVWKKNIKKVDILRARFAQIDTLDIRYHDLCRSPEEKLQEVLDFLGLEFKNSYLRYSPDDMHILGNRMRFTYKGVIREDMAWKKKLSNDSIELLTKTLEQDLKRFQFICN